MLTAKVPSQLDAEIKRQMETLSELNVKSNDEEYNEQLERVSKLYKIKAEQRPDQVSKETMLVVGANILGILLIIRHEHVNVITSRAMGMITKPKQV